MASTPRTALLGVVGALFAAAVEGDEVAPAAQGEFQRPTALAVRPGASASDYRLYVAEAGAGRIVRVARDLSDPAPVIVGFPKGDDDALPGLCAMTFLNADALAVAWTAAGHEEPITAVYSVPEENAPIQADGHRQVADARQVDLSGVVTALACGARHLFVSRQGADGASVLRLRHNSGVLGEYRPLFAIDSPHPAPLVVSPDGYLLVASREGLDGGRCRIEFYDAQAERSPPRLRLTVDLEDIRGLAYGALPRPASRLLYAINGPDAPAERQGVYRLDAAVDKQGRQACRATRVVKVDGPTALVFGPDGAMYVTTAGDEASAGALLRFEGEY